MNFIEIRLLPRNNNIKNLYNIIFYNIQNVCC